MSFFPARALAVVFAWLLGAGLAFGQPAATYADLQREAAKFYSERSYALAHAAWAEAAKLEVPASDRRTLDFYLADSLWRSRPDAPQVEAARKQLEALAGGKDTLAAEAAESLGDSWLALEGDWSRGWRDYQRALAYWAASTDLDRARGRYLGIVWKATGPPNVEDYGRRVPLEVLANARATAPDADARARASFFLARWYASSGDPFSRQRAGRELKAAVEAGPATAVYEAALFQLAEWTAESGVARWEAGGQLVLAPDWDAALELFRRFVREFPKGRSTFTERAQARIDDITRAALTISIPQQFLPGVGPRIDAAWRNVAEVRFTLSRVDLARDFRPTAQTDPGDWLRAVRVDAGDMVRQWKEADVSGSRHAPRQREIKLEPITEPGTYLVEAAAGSRTARGLLVVTGAAATLQGVGPSAVAFLCDARTGDRAVDAAATLWTAYALRDGGWSWQKFPADALKDGLATFAWKKAADRERRLLLFGRMGGQPAVATADSGGENADDEWRVQVFTDRAAYRPGDTIRWKLIARAPGPKGLTTPAGEVISFEIRDPRGESVRRGDVKLTEFGGAWGELEVGADGVLGEYSIAFTRAEKSLGGATLFRLEEYRLPEFKVTVSAGDPKRAVRLGDDLVVRVSGEYYFGGPVTDAQVTFEVRRADYVRPLPIFGGDLVMPRSGGDRVVQRETVRTGPDGTAEIRVPTPLDASGDLRFTVSARAVDSSGREVVGEGSIVVARQSYFVEMKPSRRVAQPGDAVTISLEARDGNERRVQTAGTVTVTRERWTEVWRDPQGREVRGDELDRLRRGVFPPPEEPGWRRVKQEYESVEVARAEVSTDADGRGSYAFTPAGAGFYRVAWSGADGDGPPVQAETNVWVSTTAGGMIAYRSGGVEIIVDPRTQGREGRVPVLITTDTPNRDVCLVVHAGGSLFRAEVIHLEGDAKLVELERDPRFVPNVFLTATSVRGLQFFADTREVEFPPVAHTLDVELTPVPDGPAPGAEGAVRVKVRDAAGNPVRGEFALAVTDEAISAIQEDYAGDPVEFFFGRKRGSYPGPTASVSERPFFQIVQDRAEGYAVGRAWGGAMAKNKSILEPQASAPMAEMAVPASASFADAATPAVTVRQNFSATAFWQPGLVTNAEGEAAVKFPYPDSLTTWRIVARGATGGAEFGFAEASARTTKPLIARLQAPRFLVVGDKVDVSAVVNNRTEAAFSARAELAVEGLVGAPKAQTTRVEAGGDARIQWPLEAGEAGWARLTLTATAGTLADGLRIDLPVHANGIDKSVFVAGKAVKPETSWTLSLPAARRPRSESLTIIATPSLAAAALDALPFLVTYPYGCTEQTMSRFLPAVVTARTLESLGLDRAAVADRIYGGIEPQFLARTHPPGARDAGLVELDAAVAAGLARLAELQHADGSWGWWKGDESDPFMTAYVVWGLRLAQQAGVAVRSDVLSRAGSWLRQNLVHAAEDPNLQAWLLHALTGLHRSGDRWSAEETAAVENLWGKRDGLTAYGRALFALAAHQLGDKEKAATLARNLRDGVTRDAQPGVSAATGVGQPNATAVPTAHWGSEGMFRRWQDGGVEATAFALEALLAIEPSSDLVEPAMNWLVKNRRGAQWSNTRDTAITVLAMNRYLAATRELGAAVSFEVLVNGQSVGSVKDATALAGVSRFSVDRALLRDGENVITLRRTGGDAPVYVSAQARFFTLEQPIAAAGNELFVKREYHRYAPQQTLLDGYRFDRVAWKPGESAARDERIESVITLEAKNDLEYLLIEDLKPAGVESVGVRSGEFAEVEGPDGARIPVYCELRDRKAAFFIRRLPQGVWTLRYDLRAETAGDFTALPTLGHAMYAPEIRANGESRRVVIE